ncbi:MAG: helix-turn-helix domain-containing protein [Haloarculaceae archaeon]
MRSLDVRLRPPPAVAPEAFALVADNPALAVARLHEWNPGADDSITAFYVCEGAQAPVVEALAAAPLVQEVSASGFDDNRFGLLVRLERGGDPFVERLFAAITSPGLIVTKPIVYRDGQVRARLLGTDETLSAVLEQIPGPIDVTVEAIRPLQDDPRAGFQGLTAGQRAALRAAIDLGYYENPREATHDDVAAALGCASSTASEHLRKAEARLARGAVLGF